MQLSDNPRPDPGLAPALVAAVQRVPWPKVRRYLAPCGSRMHDPQHAFQRAPVVIGRTPTCRFLRREERFDLCPALLGQRCSTRYVHHHGLAPQRFVRQLLGASRGVTPLRGGLMAPSPLRPHQSALLLSRCPGLQQPTHLGYG